MKATTRKSVKVTTVKDTDLKYFDVYEVRAVKHDEKVISYRYCLNEKDAEEARIFAKENYKDLYRSVYIMRRTVWC